MNPANTASKLEACPKCESPAAEDRDCAGLYNYRCTQCEFDLYGDFEHHMTGRAAWKRMCAKTKADMTAKNMPAKESK